MNYCPICQSENGVKIPMCPSCHDAFVLREEKNEAYESTLKQIAAEGCKERSSPDYCPSCLASAVLDRYERGE